MVVSDDDSATVNKTLEINGSPSSTDNSSYSGSDDETVIESEQPLFLDAKPPVSQHGESNTDPIPGCDVGLEDDALMAEFIQDTFQRKDPSAISLDSQPHQSEISLAAATFEDFLDPNDVVAFLHTEEETDAMMLLPVIWLES